MAIKIQHPFEPLVLCLRWDFDYQIPHSFSEFLSYDETQAVDKDKYHTQSGNYYFGTVLQKDYLLELPEEELDFKFDSIYAPSLDALLMCFLDDPNSLNNNPRYKVYCL